METSRRHSLSLALICFLCLLILGTACTAFFQPSVQATATPTASYQEIFLESLGLWQSNRIPDYQITVDVFSSYAAPACRMKAVLTVRNNKLIHRDELLTPEPIELPNGQSLLNPDCSEYERYLVTTQFEFVDSLLRNQEHIQIYKLNFDPTYGYITHLVIIGGEAVKDITYSDFKPR